MDATSSKIDIILVEPEIPQNTGNIARTCAATGTRLHLVEPLGFSIDNRYLKRAGLDYWDDLDLTLWTSLDEVMRWTRQEINQNRSIYYCTTKGSQVYSDQPMATSPILFFGKETKGLPEPMLAAHPERCIRIPMLSGKRSLNLSNAVAIITYEALRQSAFVGLVNQGALTIKQP